MIVSVIIVVKAAKVVKKEHSHEMPDTEMPNTDMLSTEHRHSPVEQAE